MLDCGFEDCIIPETKVVTFTKVSLEVSVNSGGFYIRLYDPTGDLFAYLTAKLQCGRELIELLGLTSSKEVEAPHDCQVTVVALGYWKQLELSGGYSTRSFVFQKILSVIKHDS